MYAQNAKMLASNINININYAAVCGVTIVYVCFVTYLYNVNVTLSVPVRPKNILSV